VGSVRDGSCGRDEVGRATLPQVLADTGLRSGEEAGWAEWVR